MPNTTPKLVAQDMAPEDVKVGDKIYVHTSAYLSHSVDDFIGGAPDVALDREDSARISSYNLGCLGP